jgi:hypothetical protein
MIRPIYCDFYDNNKINDLMRISAKICLSKIADISNGSKVFLPSKNL